jgi:hypothetical protein
MRKSKSNKKIDIRLRVYGIFDVKNETVVKVSLDPTELQLDLALMGGPSELMSICEFDVKLSL